MYPYIVSMLLVGVRMYPYVTRMYPYVSICYSYVTPMYPCGVLVKIVRGYFRILGDGNMFSWPLPLWRVVGRFKWESMFGLSARTKWSGRCRERWLLVEVRLYPALAQCSKTEDALPQSTYFVPAPPRGLPNKLIYGEAPARGPTLYPFIYHFSRKRFPLSYTFHWSMVRFTYLV